MALPPHATYSHGTVTQPSLLLGWLLCPPLLLTIIVAEDNHHCHHDPSSFILVVVVSPCFAAANTAIIILVPLHPPLLWLLLCWMLCPPIHSSSGGIGARCSTVTVALSLSSRWPSLPLMSYTCINQPCSTCTDCCVLILLVTIAYAKLLLSLLLSLPLRWCRQRGWSSLLSAPPSALAEDKRTEACGGGLCLQRWLVACHCLPSLARCNCHCWPPPTSPLLSCLPSEHQRRHCLPLPLM